MISFAIVAIDGCYGSSLHGLADVLVVANAHLRKELNEQQALLHWQFFTSVHNEIKTSNGLPMNHELAEQSKQQFDVIYIPGILYEGAKSFTKKLSCYLSLYQWLIKQHQGGAIICANCTSTFFLAEAGLLTNKTSTTVWWLEHLYKKRYPLTQLKFDRLIIEQGNIITASAATSHFQLGLLLLKRFIPEHILQQTAKTMLIDTRKINISPEQLLSQAREHNNKLIQDAQEWISQHINEAFTVQELSKTLATSERTLIRKFKEVLAITPLKYVQKLRINKAKYLLETSDLNLDRIIEKVGYKDRSTFSKLFSQHTGIPPISYRRQFSKITNDD
ncbi:GlxA family transcriptional regulator [Colwellia sp. 12G3]|uniref:GlxA family transcriptional regulator n=1 Tax=Colwellia sp. 12G3 TaxID=2058299 RepID=UPI0018E3665E|nr:helix-turn-helix domain-containing protein [Colwellia sp. 12G3]